MKPLWWLTKDGDELCLAMYERHYSAYQYRDGRVRKLFCGPGEKVVLRTWEGDAFFVWKKFKDDSGQSGINCSAFRNESSHQSSELVRQADAIADRLWPSERHYTYVAPQKVRSVNPGFCFQRAGWWRVGTSKGGLFIFEKEKNVDKHDLSVESWREYDIPGRAEPYRIEAPKALYCRPGGSTHRVVGADDVCHCLPAPGVAGCVLRWQAKDKSVPVAF